MEEYKGKVYYFKKGKKDRYVSYTDLGKVIIGSNCNSAGYYNLTEVTEKETVIIAKVVKCLCDYYDGISYEDFKKLVLEKGYKLAFEQPFINREGKKSTDEMRLVVYSEKLHMIIVADTINSMLTFNSIKCYCYGVNGLFLVGLRIFSHGNSDLAVFDLIYCRSYGLLRPLYSIEGYCCKNFSSKIKRCNVPSGWTYAEASNAKLDFDYFTDKFLSQCPQDLRDWFE